MRILRLDLRAFGPFTDRSLDLSEGNAGLHVLFGRNEVGKSSALRAIGGLLFGIGADSTDNFIHPYPKLRVGALVARRDGQRLEFIRRKGTKATLLAVDEKTVLAETELAAFLGGCERSQFETMFGINHEILVAGGRDIVEGRGEVGHVLFAAGAGIADLTSVGRRLDQEAAELFSPRASKPAINQALSALKTARQQLRQSQLPSADGTRHTETLHEASRQLAEDVEKQLGELSRRQARLRRLQSALPVIGRLKQIQQQQAALGTVPILPADFAEHRRQSVADLEASRRAERESAEEIQRTKRQKAALFVPKGRLPQAEMIEEHDRAALAGFLSVHQDLLAQAETIEKVFGDLKVYRKAQADLPGLNLQRDQRLHTAGEILRQLRPELPIDRAAELRLSRRQQVEIQNLGNRKEALDKQLARATAEIAETLRRLEPLEAQLRTASSAGDAGPLAEAIRQAQVQGNLDSQAADARAQLDDLQQQAAVDMSTLGLWRGTLDDLEKLSLPALETIDRFEHRMADADAALARLKDALEKIRQDLADQDRDIQRLRLESDVPSEDDVAAARRFRDLGWRLVVAQWRGGGANPVELGRFLEGEHGTPQRPAASSSANEPASLPNLQVDLAAAYELAVRHADDLADRLRREAGRVATRAAIQANHLALQRQQETLAQQQEANGQTREHLDQQWHACWQPAEIVPLPPREMRNWRQRQQALVDAAGAMRQRRAALARLDAEIARHRRQLHERLAEAGRPSDRPLDDEPLAARLARAETVRSDLDAAAASRRQLDTQTVELRTAQVAAQAKADSAAAELAAWQQDWAARIAPLSLSADTAPSVVNEVVAQTAELFKLLDEAAGFAIRIAEIAADARRFGDEVERLAASVGSDVSRHDPSASAGTGQGPERIVEDLFARLRRAMADQNSLDLLQRHEDQISAKRRQAAETAAAAEARLVALCQEAGCTRPDELAAVERASADALALRGQPETCREELLRLGAGATIDELVAEAEATEADRLPEELGRIEEELLDLQCRRDALRETIAVEKSELAKMDPGSAAADAAEEVEEILSRIEPDVRQYVRLRLASAVLGGAVQRYRKKNEGPVLARASALFRRLTLGSFAELRIELGDRDEQALAGIRPTGEIVLPPAMSEGASDQLYLALRVASLETWLERNEPLPLVLDDVLVGFDDDRATAALEVLSQLAERTQVLFFTHHAHLVELAQRCLAPDVLFVHRMEK